LAFIGKLPLSVLGVMIVGQIIIKVGYEILLLPLIIYVINQIKQRENVDYYDVNTNFNPFSQG
jgi:hypothetical protein